jgi:hypothetical protein
MDYSKIGLASVARLPVLEVLHRRHNSELVCSERLAYLSAECGQYRIDGAIFSCGNNSRNIATSLARNEKEHEIWKDPGFNPSWKLLGEEV